jgi:hypothetical protein
MGGVTLVTQCFLAQNLIHAAAWEIFSCAMNIRKATVRVAAAADIIHLSLWQKWRAWSCDTFLWLSGSKK